MTATEDKPTIGERYSSATGSSNLRHSNERRGDVDYLIAAGWLDSRLGALLFRLCTEYDAVRGECWLADAELRRQEHAARDAGKAGDAELVSDLEIRKRAAGAAVTARALILFRLKTLREAKEALGCFACIQATKQQFMRSDAEVCALTGHVLEVFLDPVCHHCHGRGFTGGSHRGEPRRPCRPCRETGHRKSAIGKDEATRGFARYLLSSMEKSLALAAAGIRRAVSDV